MQGNYISKYAHAFSLFLIAHRPYLKSIPCFWSRSCCPFSDLDSRAEVSTLGVDLLGRQRESISPGVSRPWSPPLGHVCKSLTTVPSAQDTVRPTRQGSREQGRTQRGGGRARGFLQLGPGRSRPCPALHLGGHRVDPTVRYTSGAENIGPKTRGSGVSSPDADLRHSGLWTSAALTFDIPGSSSLLDPRSIPSALLTTGASLASALLPGS